MKLRPVYLVVVLLLNALVSIGQDAPYFQQHVAYTIEVELNDTEHTLSAHLSLTYTNNSPDVLDSIYFHLWPNAYKKGNTALCEQMMSNGDLSLYYADAKDKGHIDGLAFKVNGVDAKFKYHKDHIDIGILYLNEPLGPGGAINISTPFKVKVPSGEFSRLGHIGQSYQITQWYPKPAVYDRDGWHEMPYLNQGEFYSEFGSYDVSITLPKNYVLGATGDIQDGDEEIEWLNQKVAATEAIEKFPKDNSFPESSNEMKTLRFIQDNVHDFAWFADKRYHVLKGEVELPHSQRKVTTWAMFTNSEAKLWKKSIEYLNDATYYYSLWNGDYPYNHVTAVDGTISAGGGMEYPNITVIGNSGSAISLETVIMHEVGHNWFYGVLGSNERIHPWMDEGINSFNEDRYIKTKYPEYRMLPEGIRKAFRLDWVDHKGLFYIGYTLNARRNFSQPIEMHSADYTSTNYGAIVYGKTALAFNYLHHYLGQELFDLCMRKYFDQWKFKHPGPNDLRAVFEGQSQRDLSWFFDDMLETTKTLDYKIAGLSKTASGTNLQIKNKGSIDGPFVLSELDKNDTIIRMTWYEPGTTFVDFAPLANTAKFRIDPDLDMPETNRNNNTYKLKGLFKKFEKPRLQFAGGFEDADRSAMYWAPAFGFNESDHMMVGLALYNSVVPQKKFEFTSVPLYSIASERLNGYHELAYNIFPANRTPFRNLRISGAYSSFHFFNEPWALGYYDKITGKLDFDFWKKLRDPKRHKFYARGIYITETTALAGTDANFDTTDAQSNLFTHLHYEFNNSLPLNPYKFELDLEHHADYLKGSVTFNYHFNYDESGNGLDVRLFAGKFFTNNLEPSAETPSPARYNWQMDGQAGNEDYLYDGVMADRRGGTDGLFSNQFLDNNGAFKVPAARGSSGNWLGAINFKSWVPVLPVGLFADMGWNPIGFVNGVTGEVTTETQFLYDAGVYIPVIRDQFEIYVPLVMSEDLKGDLEFADIDFWNRIRFTFNLHRMNPLATARNFNP